MLREQRERVGHPLAVADEHDVTRGDRARSQLAAVDGEPLAPGHGTQDVAGVGLEDGGRGMTILPGAAGAPAR
jgi:hypothetical protein